MASIIKELHAVAPPPKPPHGKEHLRWGPGTFGADDNANQFQAWKSPQNIRTTHDELQHFEECRGQILQKSQNRKIATPRKRVIRKTPTATTSYNVATRTTK
eukprot:m.306988 g.306988  ORF g.306988 m.306988 type:complete len:102 (-) comp20191_c1_seq69:178-483(-)